ncbi:hypothetical protein NVP1137O_31 [Vibrio phage 1.137.O._10N.261.46.B5]|nr:hypothetical protein NVP1119O_34 [Vibrio phage 1.119.O._10N.261.51.A9]AUR89628.1 hypothetical protein NVP1127O_36 [Vibrio phage 1.127.O._10N.286.52.E12]AUR90085.1 hypothetical protein NVP1137O_31 [Vibrio phage 1.137.O._10N.261.46.B5]AUR90406.1 hypothetical protein NVP1143O_34 [Vibrio phage 1.143.O._10N.261.55.C8]AUR96692.1 hypothetical protein NVP1231O_34 [Vibrio phage 1.231.O._10N.261.49.F8]
MGVEILSEQSPTARKDHDCMACEWLNNSGYATKEDLTSDEWSAYELASENKWKIKKGQKYIRQNNKYEGEVYSFTAIPEIHSICLKYDIYEC